MWVVRRRRPDELLGHSQGTGARLAPSVVNRGADVAEPGANGSDSRPGDPRRGILRETAVELAQQARLGCEDPEERCPTDAGVRECHGIGYWHPHWGHGSNHGQLETGRESIRLDEFEPTDFSSIHLQNLVIAKMGDRRGVGVVEQIALGPHRPSGLTGFLDGHP